MTWTNNIFFNSPDSLEGVIEKLETLWSIKFQQESSGLDRLYLYEGLGILVTLCSDHGMEDDLGINFSKFTYQLNVSLRKVTDFESFLRAVAFYIAYQLSEKFGWPCIVVEDVQRQLLELPST